MIRRVPGDDDDRDVVRQPSATGTGERRNPSQRMITSPGQREQERHQEEDQPGRERGVGVDPEAPEEADEERLADAEAVDRERHEHHEEEERPEHDVRADPDLDPDGPAAGPDREDARDLGCQGDRGDDEHGRDVVAVAVDALVERPREPLDLQPLRAAGRCGGGGGEAEPRRRPLPPATVPTTKSASIQRYGPIG